MHRVGFEPTVPVFQRAKTFHIRKGTVIPGAGNGGPEGCETSRLPHFLDNRLTDGGEVSLTDLPPFTPYKDSWYSFLLEAESTPGP
jgi:hypothetical protein